MNRKLAILLPLSFISIKNASISFGNVKLNNYEALI